MPNLKQTGYLILKFLAPLTVILLMSQGALAFTVYENVTVATAPSCLSWISGNQNNTNTFLQVAPNCFNNNVTIFNKAWVDVKHLPRIDALFTTITNSSAYTEYFTLSNPSQITAYDANALPLGTSTATFSNIAGFVNYSTDFSGTFDNLKWFMLDSNSKQVKIENGLGTVSDTLNLQNPSSFDTSTYMNRLAVDNKNRTFVFYGWNTGGGIIYVYNYTDKSLIGTVNVSLWGIPNYLFLTSAEGGIWANDTTLWFARDECVGACGGGGGYALKVYGFNWTQGLVYANQTNSFGITSPIANSTITSTLTNFVAHVSPSFNGTLIWRLNGTNFGNSTYSGAPAEADINIGSPALTANTTYSLTCSYLDSNSNSFNCNTVTFTVKNDFITLIGQSVGNLFGVNAEAGQNIFFLLFSLIAGILVAVGLGRASGGSGVAEIFGITFLAFVLVFTIAGLVNVLLGVLLIIIAGFIVARLISGVAGSLH